VRASISLPEAQYVELERIAKSQRVSLAWVVREAVRDYLANRWPLINETTIAAPSEETKHQ
jgi:metal-responsive CopG/Arc/MetJ family transcriptional regulator